MISLILENLSKRGLQIDCQYAYCDTLYVATSKSFFKIKFHSQIKPIKIVMKGIQGRVMVSVQTLSKSGMGPSTLVLVLIKYNKYTYMSTCTCT